MVFMKHFGILQNEILNKNVNYYYYRKGENPTMAAMHFLDLCLTYKNLAANGHSLHITSSVNGFLLKLSC